MASDLENLRLAIDDYLAGEKTELEVLEVATKACFNNSDLYQPMDQLLKQSEDEFKMTRKLLREIVLDPDQQ